jgi:hypothetical protein
MYLFDHFFPTAITFYRKHKEIKLFATPNRFSILSTKQSTIDDNNDNDNITDSTETFNQE